MKNKQIAIFRDDGVRLHRVMSISQRRYPLDGSPAAENFGMTKSVNMTSRQQPGNWLKTPHPQANYRRSNAITQVDVACNASTQTLAKKLLGSHDAQTRQRLGDSLLDELADAAQIDICTLKVSDTHQYHRRVGGRTVFKQYGYYRPQSKYIYIQNRTAVRGHSLAPKSFLETLLHEWLHHYDYQVLKLQSIHTAGFYARLRDVMQRLNIPRRGHSGRLQVVAGSE